MMYVLVSPKELGWLEVIAGVNKANIAARWMSRELTDSWLK